MSRIISSLHRLRWMATFGLLVAAAGTMLYADTAAQRLAESALVLKEVMDAPDKGIPADLLNSAYCVVIAPGVKKAGLVVGGEYGRGFIVCRNDVAARWGAPAALRIEGGSVGFQIGASATDVIMLVMDRRSVDGILSSKFTLGGAAEVSAGPVGRSSTAKTDATMRAKILSVLAVPRRLRRPGADRRDIAPGPRRERRDVRPQTDQQGDHGWRRHPTGFRH